MEESAVPSSDRRRRRWIIGGIAGVVVVAALAFALAYFQPQKLFIDEHVDEALPAAPADAPAAVAERSGSFVSLEHTTTGRATIYRQVDGKRFLRLEDLHTSNGPVLVVYLTANPAQGPEGAFDDNFIDLGGLKGNIGDQNYELPADIDLSRYASVVIWCDRFDAAFGAADLA